MVYYGPQFLYRRGSDGTMSEIVNGARTSALIQASSLCGTAQFKNPLAYGGCRALAYELDCDTSLEPVLALDARDYVGSGSWQNLGYGGSALNAALPGGAADPTFLAHTGTNYTYLPGLAGNYVSVPDAAALDITGNIELVARVAATDWTRGTAQALIGKNNTTTGYVLYIDATGIPGFLKNSGATSASADPVFVNGTTYWIKVTHNTTSGQTIFYYAADEGTEPATWTTIGTPQTLAAGSSITANSNVLEIGSYNTGATSPFLGAVYRGIVRSGIAGTTVLDVNLTATSSQTTFTCATGQTATHTRAATGKRLCHVIRPTWLFATDDYLSVPDNDLLDFTQGESFTIVACFRMWDTVVSNGYIVSKGDTTGVSAGYGMYSSSSTHVARFTMSDAGFAPNTNSPASATGTLRTAAIVRNTATDAFTHYMDGVAGTPTTDTTTATSANSLALNIGRSGSAANYTTMELFGVLIYRGALTAAQVNRVSSDFNLNDQAYPYVDAQWSAAALTAATSPWDNGTNAADEAFGFFIEEWTGLDGAHHARSVTGKGATRGGAQFGPQSHKHRTMKLNVLLVGSSERGLNYLFRWLEEELLNCCDSCSTSGVYFREFCPSDADNDPTEGLARLENVALIEGPTWEAPPMADAGCFLRRASFTIGAGDPCLYRMEEREGRAVIDASGVTLIASPMEAGCNTWLSTDMRACFSLAAPDYGEVAPIVTITSNPVYRSDGTRKPLPDLRITGFADPLGVGCDPCRNPRQGELVLSGFATSGLIITVDVAAHKITYRDPYGTNTDEDGGRYLAPKVDGLRRWWGLGRCGTGQVVVEPAYTGLWNSAEQLADPVTAWTVTVDSVNKFGCC